MPEETVKTKKKPAKVKEEAVKVEEVVAEVKEEKVAPVEEAAPVVKPYETVDTTHLGS